MIRITGGVARGVQLRPPARATTRPTSDRVRAAIFNILARWGPAGWRVLDLYAGTGSLGIEALSRGATWADFVERDARQCALLRENLSLAGFADRGAVWCTTVERALSQLTGPYDGVLLDPPYRLGTLDPVLERLALEAPLAPHALVVVEHGKHLALKERYGDPSAGPERALVRVEGPRRYGDTVVEFFRRGGG